MNTKTIREKRELEGEQGNDTSITKKKARKKTILAVIGGIFTGAINGLFGGGGGMICVPLLNKVLKEETKVSHATAILLILPITIASAIMYIMGGFFEGEAVLNTTIGVVVGGIIGALLLKKLPAKAVGLAFALLMILAGVKMLF